MTEGSTASRFAADPRLVAISLAIILSLSGLNSVLSSFNTGAALAKLAVGLTHLAVIGWGASRLLGLESPRHLAIASHMLLGQVIALGYVYIRSALCSAVGLPGISVPEVMLAEGALVWFALRRYPELPRLISQPLRSRLPSLIVQLSWLGWLAVIAFQKLDLLYTPSSDPDIHAFYTKVLIERGHLFYDLIPFSDAWMVYPSGFSCLNFILSLLSGLHPVQVVNIGPYVQFTLFCGAAFAVLSQSAQRPRALVSLGLVHFGVAYLCFNAVFAPSREMLEGTPRLAHSAVLVFPLFFVLQQSRVLGRRPLLLALPLCAVVTGICVNPTHAPAALLFGAVSLAVLCSDRETRLAIKGHGIARLARAAAVLATLFFVFLGTDPFYRSLFLQQFGPEGQVEEAQDLTGDALSLDFDLKLDLDVGLTNLLANPGGAGATYPVQIALLIGLLVCVATALFTGRTRGRSRSIVERSSLTLAVAAFACLAIHALWLEIALLLAKPEVLQGALLARYTQSLQYQINTLFFAIGFTALLVEMFGNESGEDKTSGKRLAMGLVIAVGSLPLLGSAGVDQARAYYPRLRESPLGRVYASDIEFLARARERIGDEERVLLPGRLVGTPHEHWILTTHAGRAVPLFSDIRTSFFLGLDGESFTAGAYQAHVQPPNFDPVWLRSKNILWLIESGNFPIRMLAKHYKRVFGNDHAVLWQLRADDQ